MSQSVKNRTQRKSIFRFFVIPVRFIFNGVIDLLHSTKEIALLLVPTFGKGRRNRNFEKAGKESQNVTRRRVSSTAFRKGERDRKREIIEAERESRRFLNANSAQAAEYREHLNQRKLEYSRGETINHLAMVNARHRKSKTSEEDSESPDKKRAK